MAPKASSADKWHQIPRGEIAWHPTVIEDRGIGCGLCVTSCGRNVYSFDYDTNKPFVQSPQMCMVGCTTCATRVYKTPSNSRRADISETSSASTDCSVNQKIF